VVRPLFVIISALVVSTFAVPPANVSAASAKPTIATTPYTMPTSVSLDDTPPPWASPANARPYIEAAGLTALSAEQLAVHYHAHLDVIDDDTKVTVPAGIGFVIQNGKARGISELHTHDTSGIVHIESAENVPYTLGQVFTEWGVALSATQVGGLRADGAHVLRVYVNGRRFGGDPATIRLKRHLEIALWYGPTGQKPTVPKSYRFPAGV